MLQQLALFGRIVERCSSALLLSEEILSSLLLYSVRNGFDYRKKREAERSCEFIFRIDFCRNFYPEVLGTSWMPALNINILCTEPLLCKSQSSSFPVQNSATCVSQCCGLLSSSAMGSAWDLRKEDHLNFYLLWKFCYCFYSSLQRWAACKASPPAQHLILEQWDLRMHLRLTVMTLGLGHTLFYASLSSLQT